MGDERWIGLVDDENEGQGILFYEENTARLFLRSEEATSATAYLFRLIPALLGGCTPLYARQHAAQVEALRAALWNAEQRGREAQEAARKLAALDAWLREHHLQILPDDEAASGYRLIPDNQEEAAQ
jgi:hypothetical protein